MINEDEATIEYSFLPDIDQIRHPKKYLREKEFDCFVVLDCSDLERTGDIYRINKNKKLTLNIDHHISNINFADINWVDPNASSTSEMVYKLYKQMRIPIDRDTAVCLYTGIFTDTGSFRYSNTSSFTHKVASELLKYNLDVPMLYKSIYENIPYIDMKLLLKILPGMKRASAGRLVWFQVKHNLLKNKKLSFDLTEHVLSFGRSIKGAEVVAMFKENLGVKDEVRVNLRSNGAVDVNKIAAHFGGGGHRTASGATAHGKIDTIRRKVLAKIKESLK